LQAGSAVTNSSGIVVHCVHIARGPVYVDLLEYVATVRDLVNRTRPMLVRVSDPGPPDLPANDERRKLDARVAAFGSSAVRDLLDAALGRR
jgi:hypothetical protein